MGTLRIVSPAHRVFADRLEAGTLLAAELEDYAPRRPVVLGVPRGGVVVADAIARALHAQLDVVLARKIGSPSNSEVAVGAVSEDGGLFLNDLMVSTLKVPPEYIERRREAATRQLGELSAMYRRLWPRQGLTARTVIVADDGAATGATMQAALWTVSQEHPEELLCALPAAPDDTLDKLALYADHTICICAPRAFEAVSQFYRRFEPVEDADVMSLLRSGAPAAQHDEP
jgi:predicted phosphoribosyltransferase